MANVNTSRVNFGVLLEILQANVALIKANIPFNDSTKEIFKEYMKEKCTEETDEFVSNLKEKYTWDKVLTVLTNKCPEVVRFVWKFLTESSSIVSKKLDEDYSKRHFKPGKRKKDAPKSFVQAQSDTDESTTETHMELDNSVPTEESTMYEEDIKLQDKKLGDKELENFLLRKCLKKKEKENSALKQKLKEIEYELKQLKSTKGTSYKLLQSQARERELVKEKSFLHKQIVEKNLEIVELKEKNQELENRMQKVESTQTAANEKMENIDVKVERALSMISDRFMQDTATTHAEAFDPTSNPRYSDTLRYHQIPRMSSMSGRAESNFILVYDTSFFCAKPKSFTIVTGSAYAYKIPLGTTMPDDDAELLQMLYERGVERYDFTAVAYIINIETPIYPVYHKNSFGTFMGKKHEYVCSLAKYVLDCMSQRGVNNGMICVVRNVLNTGNTSVADVRVQGEKEETERVIHECISSF